MKNKYTQGALKAWKIRKNIRPRLCVICDEFLIGRGYKAITCSQHCAGILAHETMGHPRRN